MINISAAQEIAPADSVSQLSSADAATSTVPNAGTKSGPAELLRQPYPGDLTKEIVLIRATFAPGDSTPPHHHPGILTGYVLRGEYEFQLEGQPLQRFTAGCAFFEPPGAAHVVSRNPGESATEVLAFIVRDKDAKVMIPLGSPGQSE